jgi:hypothetical protein
MQGVDALGDFAVQLGLKMMTLPGENFVIRRQALAMIKKTFDANGIKFAYPTVQIAGDGEPLRLRRRLRRRLRLRRRRRPAGTPADPSRGGGVAARASTAEGRFLLPRFGSRSMISRYAHAGQSCRHACRC